MTTRETILLMAGLWLFVLLAIFGRLRLWLLQRALDRDWRALVAFAHALDETAHSAGGDKRARAVLLATAPLVARQADPSTRALIADLASDLADPASETPPGLRPAAVREKLLPVEVLLQSEMKQLRKESVSLMAWLFEAAAGILLPVLGGPGVLGSAGRLRRRELEARPVVHSACLGLATLLVAFAVGLVGLGLAPLLAQFLSHPAG
jgi:hypothetical protein